MVNLSDKILNYGFLGFLRLIKDTFLSKVFIGMNVRKVKYPFYILGNKYINFNKNFTAGLNLRIEVLPGHLPDAPQLNFGENVKINDYVHIACIERISIGGNTLIGSHVLITDHNHGEYSSLIGKQDHPSIPPDKRSLCSSKVLIGTNVWIGEFVTVLPGSSIGDGSIIGAMSMVKGSIPPNSIAVGIPAKVVKRFNSVTSCWEKV